jgi:hypothetical protein
MSVSTHSYRWKLWRLEALIYWLEPEKADRKDWLPVLKLMALTFAVEAIMFLWIGGALKP